MALGLAALPLAPLLVAQGRRVRRVTPRLPPAAGPVAGIVGDDGAGAPLSLLAIGESTVAGVGAATHADALTGQLARGLAAATGRRVAWQAHGLSGATVAQARASLLPGIAGSPLDLIVVAFGVNDVLEHTRPARYAERVAALVAALRARGGPAPALLCAAPPMARFPSLPAPLSTYLGARAQLLNRALHRARIERATLVTPAVRIEPALFAEDGFHPSPAGYAVWAEALAAAALHAGFLRGRP
ncbi:MAG: SGNH/GDSL hydrolase family protein [Burkholderiales bacterium]|nr:SGNH/GDSL hydrolase family protein [Burkholderiales bacterium]